MLTVLVWFPFLPGEGPPSGKGEAPSSLGVPLSCFRELLLSGQSWRSGCFPFPKYQSDLLATWALSPPYWDQEHFSQAARPRRGSAGGTTPRLYTSVLLEQPILLLARTEGPEKESDLSSVTQPVGEG